MYDSTGMAPAENETEAEVKMLRNKYKAVPAKLDLRPPAFPISDLIYGMPPGADCSL